jgi:hypothetical protein
VNRVCERGGSLRPDTRDGLPLTWVGCDDVSERAETFEEEACNLDGNARRRRERCFGRMGAGTGKSLRIRGAIASRRLLPPHSQTSQPLSRIAGVVATKDSDSQIGNAQPETPECLLVHWALSQVRSLDEQVGPTCSAAQSRDLQPQSSLEERVLEIQHTFPLDNRARSHHVVADRKASPDHGHAKLFETPRHSRRKLMHVGCHDGHMNKCRVRHTGERDEFEKCAPTSHFAKAKWQ